MKPLTVPAGFTEAMALIMREERASIDRQISEVRDELAANLVANRDFVMGELARLVAAEVAKQTRLALPRKRSKLTAVV